jgi:hypothetical protein
MLRISSRYTPGVAIITRMMLGQLVDEVYDCGDTLLIKDDGESYTIRLADIVNVNQALAMNPPKVTFQLRTPWAKGSEVSFVPAVGFRINRFASIPKIDDLIRRVDDARFKSQNLLDQ